MKVSGLAKVTVGVQPPSSLAVTKLLLHRSPLLGLAGPPQPPDWKKLTLTAAQVAVAQLQVQVRVSLYPLNQFAPLG